MQATNRVDIPAFPRGCEICGFQRIGYSNELLGSEAAARDGPNAASIEPKSIVSATTAVINRSQETAVGVESVMRDGGALYIERAAEQERHGAQLRATINDQRSTARLRDDELRMHASNTNILTKFAKARHQNSSS